MFDYQSYTANKINAQFKYGPWQNGSSFDVGSVCSVINNNIIFTGIVVTIYLISFCLVSFSFSLGVSFQNVYAKAIYDNIAESPDELAFKRGDLLTVIEQDTDGLEGWWLCTLRGRQVKVHIHSNIHLYS